MLTGLRPPAGMLMRSNNGEAAADHLNQSSASSFLGDLEVKPRPEDTPPHTPPKLHPLQQQQQHQHQQQQHQLHQQLHHNVIMNQAAAFGGSPYMGQYGGGGAMYGLGGGDGESADMQHVGGGGVKMNLQEELVKMGNPYHHLHAQDNSSLLQEQCGFNS